MRILHANIFGFGKWVDYSLEFPLEGPVIIYGENESGKSTFHQFILFMLFGMAPKQRKFYQPKTSSKFGGQLLLSDSEFGEFTIERFDDKDNGAATCFTSTGETYDEGWLKERLRGMNQKTFEAIFSFSALDLNEIKKMDEEDLGEVLLSIGLTGSDNIYQVEKQLDTRLNELFRPQGKNPKINKQLQTLNELADQLTENEKEEATYREKIIEAQGLTIDLEGLQLEKQQLEGHNNFITKQRTALPVIQEYQFLSSKQKEFIEDVAFPEKGIKRLEKIKDELRPLESEYTVLQNNQASYKESLETLNKQQFADRLLDEIQQKENAVKEYFILEKEISELKTKEATLEREISEELEHLQIALEQMDLNEISLPFYIEETWKQLKVDKEMLVQEETSLMSEERGLIEEQKYLENELNHHASTLLSDEKVTTLKSKLEQGKEYEQLERLHEASTQKAHHFKKEKKQKLIKANRFLGGSIILFIIGMAAAYFLDQSFLYGLSILILLVGIGQSFFTKQNVKQLEEMLQAPIDIQNKERLSQNEITEIERKLKEEEEKQNEINRIQTALQNQSIILLKWEEKQRILLERNNRHFQQVEDQYTLYPYLEKINISYWPEYHVRLKTLLKWNAEYNQIISEIQVARGKLRQIEEGISSFMQTNFPEQQDSNISQMLESIQQLLKNNQQTKQRISHLEEQLNEAFENITILEKRMSVYQNEIEELFEIAHIDSEEEFYKLATYVAEKEKIEDNLETNQRQLDAVFPEGSWSAIIKEKLDELELIQHQEKLDGNVSKIEQKIENTRSELAEIHAELKRLESSEAHSQKIHQFEMEKEKLNQLAKEWAILKVEKEVLAESKQNYREKYLSKVMEETAEFLNTVTAGNYVTVYSPENKESFRLMAADGIRYSVNELSQGTMNQLYVSLRLAISKVMTENHQLPFILDDAFVHFDEVRVKRMMEVLIEIAEKQQVIMFTCKNDIRDVCDELRVPSLKL